VVPLALAGRLIGELLLIATGDRQPYSPRILPFLADLGARAGIAIAQVRQHRMQVQVSQQLQRALLPIAPPPLPGLQVAARYLAGAENLEVGGDWWDVVRLGDARVAVAVGDVSGKGVDAATVMGHARVAARAAAIAGLSPAQVLALVDHELADLLDSSGDRGLTGPQFATCVLAVMDLVTGRTVIANAGHLPILLHHPDTGCRFVRTPPGLPLGLDLDGYTETTIEVPPRTSLMVFTDGLVEDRTQDLDEGLGLLAQRLNVHVHEDVDTCLDKVIASLGLGGTHSSDDVAVVLIRRDAER
jgi:serine phosphatase RsbU (regulator of sigma subunit)